MLLRPARITKATSMMKMQYFHFLYSKKVNMVLQRLYRSTSPSQVHTVLYVQWTSHWTMQNNKMKASVDELQAIIDETWKNPEFQEASKLPDWKRLQISRVFLIE